jgi:hypothetical protein
METETEYIVYCFVESSKANHTGLFISPVTRTINEGFFADFDPNFGKTPCVQGFYNRLIIRILPILNFRANKDHIIGILNESIGPYDLTDNNCRTYVAVKVAALIGQFRANLNFNLGNLFEIIHFGVDRNMTTSLLMNLVSVIANPVLGFIHLTASLVVVTTQKSMYTRQFENKLRDFGISVRWG